MVFVPVGTPVRVGNVASGKVLDAGDVRAGERVRQHWPARDRPDQWWRLDPVPGRAFRYRILNAHSGLALTGRADGVVLSSDVEDPQAVWSVVPLADDEYLVQNTAHDRALDLHRGFEDDDTPVNLIAYWHNPQQRWRLHTGVAPGGTRAVMTMVYNEEVLLPIWLGYYSRFFAPEDIYVLDHGTTDGSTDRPGFNRVPVHHDEYSGQWQRDVCQRFQHELIERYDVVLHTDVDEIVAPDPRSGDLGEYIDRFDDDFVTCTGYEVLHMKDTEPAYDPGRPVLDQRGTWFPNDRYAKPLLARVPMHWVSGCHDREDRLVHRDASLHLLHLHRFDYDHGLTRHRVRTDRKQRQRDVERGWGYQNRITDENRYARWFYQEGIKGGSIEPEPIPPQWKGLF
ncbi:RICIN domain-containing protein [Saccharothrix saharensis]|uniref:RICIN domain-containing protein n=1 Tax=Saccharothrix saharensis TaxID=571190 RepID=UPI0036757DDA